MLTYDPKQAQTDPTMSGIDGLTWQELATAAEWPKNFAQCQVRPLEWREIVGAYVDRIG
jgi:hypothetical protein